MHSVGIDSQFVADESLQLEEVLVELPLYDLGSFQGKGQEYQQEKMHFLLLFSPGWSILELCPPWMLNPQCVEYQIGHGRDQDWGESRPVFTELIHGSILRVTLKSTRARLEVMIFQTRLVSLLPCMARVKERKTKLINQSIFLVAHVLCKTGFYSFRPSSKRF